MIPYPRRGGIPRIPLVGAPWRRDLGCRRGDGERRRVPGRAILLQRSLRRPPRQYLRVTWRGYFVADCASVAEVARHVDLAALEDEPAHPRSLSGGSTSHSRNGRPARSHGCTRSAITRRGLVDRTS
jgi:hypothetical protein